MVSEDQFVQLMDQLFSTLGMIITRDYLKCSSYGISCNFLRRFQRKWQHRLARVRHLSTKVISNDDMKLIPASSLFIFRSREILDQYWNMDLTDLREEFRLLDINRDGVITRKEFIRVSNQKSWNVTPFIIIASLQVMKKVYAEG